MTFILIISSVTMVLAVHAGHKGDKQGVIKWIAWTIVGGLAFLGCQAWEWHHLITGEHAVLVDGHIEMIGQTMGGNPWGQLVDPALAQQAFATTPHETLVHLAHEYPKVNTAASLEALEKMKPDQLAAMIDASAAHIRTKGPIAFGGYFYGITGFHGFHVFSGVIINIIMLIMTQRDVFARRGHYLMIEKAGLYWHFVDLVWVFVFLCFYLI
jgi:cytochrome c oxidase subunit 3